MLRAPPTHRGDAPPAGYPAFLAEVKVRIAATRTLAALAVNSELVRLYWEIGREILERERREGWDGVPTSFDRALPPPDSESVRPPALRRRPEDRRLPAGVRRQDELLPHRRRQWSAARGHLKISTHSKHL